MNTFTRSGLTFDVVDSGPSDGSAVIALHGFPANPRSWERLTPALLDAGHRVLAPAQRGYSPGARPPRRADYRVSELVDDVVALADQAGLERFALAGHDWGAAVAWALAERHPERVSSLTSLSIPHTRAFLASMAGTQLLRSWYMVAFQVPGLAERALLSRLGPAALVRTGLDPELAADYVDTLRAPGAMIGALNWYRALPLQLRDIQRQGAVRTPTLLVWGSAERFVGRRSVERCADWVHAPYRLEIIEGGSHWLPERHADRVGALLVDHLATHP